MHELLGHTLAPAHSSAEDGLFLHHPVPLWVYDRTTLKFIAVNDAAIAQYGYSRDQFLAMRVVDIRPDADDEEVRRLLANPGRRKRWRQYGVQKHRCADGRIIHAEITSHDLEFEGRPAVAVAAYDITERLAAEAATREAEQRLREAQHLSGLGSWRWEMANGRTTWSDELFHILGIPTSEGAPPFAELLGVVAEEDRPRLDAAVRKALADGTSYELLVQMRRRDGSMRCVIARGAPIRDEAGQLSGLHGTAHDVTERCHQDELLHSAYERLQDSEGRYRELVESLDDVVFSVDPAGTILYTSQAVEHFGYGPTELVGRPFSSVVHPDDRASAIASFGETLAGSRQRREFRVLDKAGQTRYVRSSNRVQFRNGEPVAVTGVLIDLTEQRRTQDQLRAAGRLEAVGRLAGGVAHDFNNLLVAINGFAEMALADIAEGTQLHSDLSEILKAGNRAAALTAQLLAFSRNQVLRPDSVDLNEIVHTMEPMLRRLIGEDIELQIRCAPNVPHVRIDPGHLEQMVMNLVVNARDAMPDGGTLRIETGTNGFTTADLPAGLAPSDIGVLTVSDTGTGMSEATQAQIFEPFFTTKPLGQGTGLGLAMVYGFVKQSGGAIAVRSAPGKGASFRIAIPQHHESRETRTERTHDVEGGSETILVAEDEDTVRTLVRRLLSGAGYTVLTANSADAALRICRDHTGPIDLLLTDVVMPQMNGPALATRATKLRPDMHVLFMSGYTGTDISARGLDDGTAKLLQKPFSAAALSEAVRSALTPGQGSSLHA
ncbi:MAG: PAS domain S-box protein [Vicinamibacterales bacterium]